MTSICRSHYAYYPFSLLSACLHRRPTPCRPLSLRSPNGNFLFLYQALKYFQGPLEPLVWPVSPAVLVMVLVALPFLDRSSERNPLKRPFALTGAALLAALADRTDNSRICE